MSWFDTEGQALDEAAWQNPEERTLALRRAARREDSSVDITLLLLNPGHEAATFLLPQPAEHWIRELDSGTLAPAAPLSDARVPVGPRSVVLLSAAKVQGAAP